MKSYDKVQVATNADVSCAILSGERRGGALLSLSALVVQNIQSSPVPRTPPLAWNVNEFRTRFECLKQRAHPRCKTYG